MTILPKLRHLGCPYNPIKRNGLAVPRESLAIQSKYRSCLSRASREHPRSYCRVGTRSFLRHVVTMFRGDGRLPDACVGYALKHDFSPRNAMVCTKPLYNCIVLGIIVKRGPTSVAIGCCGGSFRKADALKSIRRGTSVSLPIASTAFSENRSGIMRRKNCSMRCWTASMLPENSRDPASRQSAAVGFLCSGFRLSPRKSTVHSMGCVF